MAWGYLDTREKSKVMGGGLGPASLSPIPSLLSPQLGPVRVTVCVRAHARACVQILSTCFSSHSILIPSPVDVLPTWPYHPWQVGREPPAALGSLRCPLLWGRQGQMLL